MSGQHTSGPWKVIETHYLPHDGDHVADMSNGLMVVPSMFGLGDPLADARLIAAAPDLLEALKVLADEANGFSISGVYFNEKCMGHKGLDMAFAAIAKATGEQP